MGLTPGTPILLVGGDASRTGTPRLVLSLLRWLRDETDHPTHLVLDRGGPLLADLAAAATSVTVLAPASTRGAVGYAEAALAEVGRPGAAHRVRSLATRRALRRVPRPGLIWLHGAGALRHLDALPGGVPVVAHVHELRAGIDRSLHGLDAEATLARPDRLVAVSHAVADHLVDDRGVPRGKVAVHHGWLPEPWPGPSTAPRAQSGGDRALVVGGCGTLGWRKGSDLFVHVAQAVLRARADRGDRPVRFEWLGGGDPVTERRFRADLAARGLSDAVRPVPERPDPATWFAGLDAFVLSSREDPFPLVALEAAASRLPLLTFASGGAAELFDRNDRALFVARPLDVADLAARLDRVLSTPDVAEGPTTRLHRTALSAHTAGTAIPLLWSTVVATA